MAGGGDIGLISISMATINKCQLVTFIGMGRIGSHFPLYGNQQYTTDISIIFYGCKFRLLIGGVTKKPGNYVF